MTDNPLAVAARGWPIFPIVPGEKTPACTNGVLDATTNPETIRKWWTENPEANIGLNVGEAGMMVIDLDPGSSMEELEQNIGPIPDTALHVSTPRGGRHLYFSLAEGEIVAASSSKVAKHVDIRSFHSYVLLPPSTTKDGEYKWTGQGKPAFRTDEMIRVCNSAKERSEDHDTWIIEPDLPENMQKCKDWLQNTAKVSIEGEGGNHCGYATAAMCKSYGISEETASLLMFDHWNERCNPPWEIEDLVRFCENAYQYNTSPPGNMTDAYQLAKQRQDFEPVEVEEDDGTYTVGRYTKYTRAALEKIPPSTWLIEDFITEGGQSILFGEFGSCKTFAALDIALTIAAGYLNKPCWESKVAGPVCYVAGEGVRGITARVKAWEALHYWSMPVETFTLTTPVPGVLEAPPQDFLNSILNVNGNYKLIVLDTVARALQGHDDNSAEAAGKLTALVEHIQKHTGAAVMCVAHTGLNDKSRIRGSSGFGADADTLVGVTKRS
ncbi:MAG: bifunctional DNA primase/polymerase, partial [Dehalococcoidia bacterium]